MRILILLVSALVLATPWQGPAEAKSRKARAQAHTDHQHSARVYGWRHRDSSDFRDHLRAQSCDAAGEYRGYPDWARAAFTCGRSR